MVLSVASRNPYSSLKIRTHGRIRTLGLRNRNPTLYPTELRALFQQAKKYNNTALLFKTENILFPSALFQDHAVFRTAAHQLFAHEILAVLPVEEKFGLITVVPTLGDAGGSRGNNGQGAVPVVGGVDVPL